MMESLRNFKDFLQIFNLMSETCFTRCVNTFQSRDLTDEESHCVELCSNKIVRVNHKIMGVYMEVQPLVIQRRVEEMEKLNPTLPPQTIEEVQSTSVDPIPTAAVAEVPASPSQE